MMDRLLALDLLLATVAGLYYAGSTFYHRAGSPLFGQGSSGETTVVGALIGGFTLMAGLMAWTVKRLLEKTIPDLQDSYQKALTSQQETFRDESREQRTLFETKLKSEREFFRQEILTLLSEFKEDRKEILDRLRAHEAVPLPTDGAPTKRGAGGAGRGEHRAEA